MPRVSAKLPPEAILKPGGKAKAARKPKLAKPDPANVAEIFRRFEVAEPAPKGELVSLNPYTFLVAVALSAQATDVSVNKATKPLFAIADTPAKMLALGEDRVREAIRTVGLYRNKAKNVIALSQRLIDNFDGVVPGDRDALQTLPGVGRKTANVVMNNAFGAATIAVDTHVFRVSNRVPIALGTTPDKVEEGLEMIIPTRYKQHAHHWLILHGRYVCKARRPECERCLIADLCRSVEKRV